jgi:sulfide dehydrogenase cytochrome subunit
MKQRSLLLAACGLAIGAAHAADPKIEALARTCNACHGENGVSVGPNMPSIGGLSETYLEQVMLQWKNGERYSATMGRHFKGYSDVELASLAKLYAQLPWVPVVQQANAKLLAQGKVASERCETCHGATGGEPDDKDTPKLNGQWAEYIHLEMLKYRNDAVKMPHRKMRGNTKKLDEVDLVPVARHYAAQPK